MFMKGFTLLELMVVVIIIGILSAVALPQYTKAVEKSRAAEAVTLGKAITDSQNRSLDAFPNDSVAAKSALDIQMPTGAWSGNVFTTPNFTYTLLPKGVMIARVGGSMAYSLFMGNNNFTGSNYCSGSICASMKGMGFVIRTALEHEHFFDEFKKDIAAEKEFTKADSEQATVR